MPSPTPPPPPLLSTRSFPAQEDVPQSFGETLLCYLLPPLRHWLAASRLRPLLGSALLTLSSVLGSTYLPADSSRAGLQVLVVITITGLVFTLNVSMKIKVTFAVLSVLVLTQIQVPRLGTVTKTIE